MDEIARAAGVGKATLYRYFYTKEGLLRACLESIVDDLGLRMEQAESTDAATSERLKAVVGIMVDAFSHDLLPLRPLTRRQVELDEEWRRSVNGARRRLVKVLDLHFRRGAEEGVYRELDLALVPHLIMGMIRSGVTHAGGISSRRIVEEICDFTERATRRSPAYAAGPR